MAGIIATSVRRLEKPRIHILALLTVSFLPALVYVLKLPQILLSFSLYSSVILVCFISQFYMLKYFDSRDRDSMLMLFITVLTLIIEALLLLRLILCKADLQLLRNMIYFISLTFTIYFAFNVRFRKSEIKLMCVYAIFSIFVFFPFIFQITSYDLNNFEGRLYLNFPNPNVLSYVATIYFLFSVLSLYIFTTNFSRLMSIVSAVMAFSIIVLSESRTSLISVLILLLLLMIPANGIKLHKLVLVIITFIPLIIVACGSMIDKLFMVLPVFNMRPGLSGRAEIWKIVTDSICSNSIVFLFGSTHSIKSVMSASNFPVLIEFAGNAYLQWIFATGIVVFSFSMLCLLKLVIKAFSKPLTAVKYFTLLCYLSLLLSNSFETHMVDSIFGLTILMLIFPQISISLECKETYVVTNNNFDDVLYRGRK